MLLTVLTLFVLHEVLHVGPATAALAGAAVLLLITRADTEEAFRIVEWPTLFFFIGLFVTVSGLAASGVIEHMAGFAMSLTGNSLLVTALVVLWFSALSSSFVGAIPMVTALIPVMQHIIPELEAHTGVEPVFVRYAVWWSLSLGACLGGNGTMFGAAANIVVVEIARNNNHEISFKRFMMMGMPIMLATLLFASFYVALRYVV